MENTTSVYRVTNNFVCPVEKFDRAILLLLLTFDLREILLQLRDRCTVSVIFARSASEVPCFNTVVGIDYVICPGRSPHLSWLYRTSSFERTNERQENSSPAGLNCRVKWRVASVVISSRLQSFREVQLLPFCSEPSLCAQFALSKLTLIRPRAYSRTFVYSNTQFSRT